MKKLSRAEYNLIWVLLAAAAIGHVYSMGRLNNGDPAWWLPRLHQVSWFVMFGVTAGSLSYVGRYAVEGAPPG